jgi:hypothetical protein
MTRKILFSSILNPNLVNFTWLTCKLCDFMSLISLNFSRKHFIPNESLCAWLDWHSTWIMNKWCLCVAEKGFSEIIGMFIQGRKCENVRFSKYVWTCQKFNDFISMARKIVLENILKSLWNSNHKMRTFHLLIHYLEAMREHA